MTEQLTAADSVNRPAEFGDGSVAPRRAIKVLEPMLQLLDKKIKICARYAQSLSAGGK